MCTLWRLERSGKPPDHRSVFEVLLLIYWTKVRRHDCSCLSQGFNYLRTDSRCTCETAFWCLMTNAFSYTAHSSINGKVLVNGVELILFNMIQNFVKGFLLQKLCAQTGFLDYNIFSNHIITIYHDELNLFMSGSKKKKKKYYPGKKSQVFLHFWGDTSLVCEASWTIRSLSILCLACGCLFFSRTRW